MRAFALAAALLAGLTALGACGSPRPVAGPYGEAVAEDGLSLTAPASSYGRGQEIPLVLRNSGPHTLEGGVASCARAERWAHGRWTLAEDDQRACIAMLAQLAPGAEERTAVTLDLPPGTYRLTHTMSRAGVGGEAARVTAATAAIRLGPRPAR